MSPKPLMPEFPKPSRVRDARYLAFLRGLHCVICAPPPLVDVGRPLRPGQSEPHHLRTRGAGGSDFEAISVCRMHHEAHHRERVAEVEALRLQRACLTAYLVTVLEPILAAAEAADSAALCTSGHDLPDNWFAVPSSVFHALHQALVGHAEEPDTPAGGNEKERRQ